VPYELSDFSILVLQQVNDTIAKMAKKGLTPSQIGVLLRDSHGIAQVKSVTGSKILRILKGQGGQPGEGLGLATVQGFRATSAC
jgi:small subunit ribosomal protein S13e